MRRSRPVRLMNVAFTVVALFTVDRLGRKPLMMLGTDALIGMYVLITLAYQIKALGSAVPNTLFLVLILGAIASYAMSLAPVTWVVILEIFPNRVSRKAMSVAVGALWLACFGLTCTFPNFNALLGAAITFGFYAGICAGGFAFILVRLPETKGRSLETIERKLLSA